MNQKDALRKLKDKSKYIDLDVFQNIEERIKKDIKEDIKKENDEFSKKAILIINQGVSINVLRNMILSDIYSSKLMGKLLPCNFP
ncbi:hypothetical protein [Aquimarina macrocephali]|uniref:hypothetical protein n=1 Tax=Aquimarina macrocephali TaxID=666563 RepID=UPI00046469C6|nr:hypothetical protein [Aquimarina macrocephali]